jgi:hypothetical protein
MVGHGAKFGRKKEEAIAALLSQRSVEDAARVAKIGANTLLRWLQLPEFRDAYPPRATVDDPNNRPRSIGEVLRSHFQLRGKYRAIEGAP